MAQTDYSDILHLPHHVSETRPRMPLSDRAAQFMPFAALTGYDDAVKETARLTQQKKILSEDHKKHLDEQLLLCQKEEHNHPFLEITYFEPDPIKAGGVYKTIQASLKKIDVHNQYILLEKHLQIPLDNLFELEILINDM